MNGKKRISFPLLYFSFDFVCRWNHCCHKVLSLLFYSHFHPLSHSPSPCSSSSSPSPSLLLLLLLFPSSSYFFPPHPPLPPPLPSPNSINVLILHPKVKLFRYTPSTLFIEILLQLSIRLSEYL